MTNRIVKFRAWIKDYEDASERMKYDVWLNPKGEVCMPDGEFYKYPLMQFTGLTDKNGKEIYDGDIVRCDGRPDGHLVEFVQHDSGGRFQYTHPKRGRWSGYKEFVEIIGNIYENPELFK